MIVSEIAGIAIAVIVLTAFVAAISPKSQASAVIGSGLGGFNQLLQTSLSPLG